MTGRLRETWRGGRRLLATTLYRRITAGVALAYTAVFLWLMQDLSFSGFTPTMSFEVLDPGFMFRSRGPFSFEAVAVLELPVATLLVSPLNLLLAGFVGFLVGVNLAYSYAAFSHPSACNTGNTAGVLAGVPALAAGSACCAPVIFIVLGVQATAGLLALQTLLLPASVVALLLSVVYVNGKVDHSALTSR